MCKIKLTREYPFKIRQINDNTKFWQRKIYSICTQDVYINYTSIFCTKCFLVHIVLSTCKRLEPHLAASHENHNQSIIGNMRNTNFLKLCVLLLSNSFMR